MNKVKEEIDWNKVVTEGANLIWDFNHDWVFDLTYQKDDGCLEVLGKATGVQLWEIELRTPMKFVKAIDNFYCYNMSGGRFFTADRIELPMPSLRLLSGFAPHNNGILRYFLQVDGDYDRIYGLYIKSWELKEETLTGLGILENVVGSYAYAHLVADHE